MVGYGHGEASGEGVPMTKQDELTGVRFVEQHPTSGVDGCVSAIEVKLNFVFSSLSSLCGSKKVAIDVLLSGKTTRLFLSTMEVSVLTSMLLEKLSNSSSSSASSFASFSNFATRVA